MGARRVITVKIHLRSQPSGASVALPPGATFSTNMLWACEDGVLIINGRPSDVYITVPPPRRRMRRIRDPIDREEQRA